MSFKEIKNKMLNSPNHLPEIYGTFIFLGLLTYFFLMSILGLIEYTYLRILNLIPLGFGIYYALQQYKRTHHGMVHHYKAYLIGVGASFVGVTTFTLFIFLYLLLNPAFMETIRHTEPLGGELNPYMASFGVWIEGTFSGFFATYLLANSTQTEPRHTP